ncbi:unnamed protein product [Mesocestoides corti]|uniref:SAM-dependent MTase TRM10-type domain-containing protein n=1 Tax=Mesocestoides corti TaxID=53468 RepID=A0A0R3U903_MESCO|nr:unnamed protein product [Mesocestoides corti]
MLTADISLSRARHKRRNEKLRRRKRNAEILRRHLEAGGTHVSKREKIRIDKANLQLKLAEGVKFCFDCAFESEMSAKEQSKFAQQLCRAYGANKKATTSLSLHLVNYDSSGLLAECCRKKCSGFLNYQIGFHAGPPTEVFKSERIVYLSPDATDALLDIDSESVYVAGGLVDENLLKGKSLDTAAKLGVPAVRLPIQEFAPPDWCPQNKIKSCALPLNTVVEIFLVFLQHRDWRKTFEQCLPLRFRNQRTVDTSALPNTPHPPQP